MTKKDVAASIAMTVLLAALAGELLFVVIIPIMGHVIEQHKTWLRLEAIEVSIERLDSSTRAVADSLNELRGGHDALEHELNNLSQEAATIGAQLSARAVESAKPPARALAPRRKQKH